MKLGTTSTFVTSVNRTPPLYRVTSKRPTAGSGGKQQRRRASNAQQRLVEQEEKERTRRAGGGGKRGVGGTKERRRLSLPTRALYAALSFSRDSPSPPILALPRRPAFSRARPLANGEQTGFAIKRIPSRNARDQRERI